MPGREGVDMRYRRGRVAAVAASVVAAFVTVSVADTTSIAAQTTPATTSIGTMSEPVVGRLTVKPLRELAAEHATSITTATIDEGLGRGGTAADAPQAGATGADPVVQTTTGAVGDGPIEL